MLKTNVETFLGCESPWEEARIVIYGAPFDSTTSFRPGTRFASRTMRGESYGLETYSPYQDLDLEDAAIMDSGVLAIQRWLLRILRLGQMRLYLLVSCLL